MCRLLHIISVIVLLVLPMSCISSDGFEDTRRDNFEALWKVIDRHYCFFSYKKQAYGLDWDEVYRRYSPQVEEKMSDEALFQVLSRMTYELRDGHVNLAYAGNTSYYTQWYDAFPENFNDSILRRYLGSSDDYRTTAGMKYKVMANNIGYIRCPSFENSIGDGNLHYMMEYLATCDGLIIDVRNNGGGMLTSAQALAGIFVNESTVMGFMSHKTGPGHEDFSAPQPIRVSPASGLRWQKPTVILTNRRTYSAANAFVMFVKSLESVTLIGDRTGGGSGMPFSSELPRGWSVRFSACPMTDITGEHTEFGIDPDINVDISSEDYNRGIDTILETALQYLAEKCRRADGQ